MKRPKQLDLIFTRDFGLFTAEFWRDSLMAQEIKKICGQGITEQVTWYNGQVEKYYRLNNEVAKLKKRVLNLPLDHYLLSKQASLMFKKDVQSLRELINNFKPKQETDLIFAFREALLLMSRLYPWYMMSIFIPGPWAQDFLKIHTEEAKSYLERQYENRLSSEGLLKEFSLFIRKILAFKLRLHGYQVTFANVLRYKEGVNLIEKNLLPPILKLKQRLRGYVSTRNYFTSIRTFTQITKKLCYEYTPIKLQTKTISGTVAFSANKTIKGRVKLVFNYKDVVTFPKGAILVTPMTAPDFLPAMQRAVAIITDEGGVTCHAAIVARELKKPCIIGTRFATKVLIDGNMVEVDAFKGIIKRLI